MKEFTPQTFSFATDIKVKYVHYTVITKAVE